MESETKVFEREELIKNILQEEKIINTIKQAKSDGNSLNDTVELIEKEFGLSKEVAGEKVISVWCN